MLRGYAAPLFTGRGSETPLASWDQSCEAASVSGPGPVRGHSLVVSRFVEACSADDRIVAAFLCGSHARGEADEYSDLDLGVITRDDALKNVMAERAGFVDQLGELRNSATPTTSSPRKATMSGAVNGEANSWNVTMLPTPIDAVTISP